MAQEKSLREVLRAFRAVSGMKEREGLSQTMREQIGRGNVFRMLGKSALKGSFFKNMKDLFNFRMGNLGAYFFIAQWEVLGSREAIVDGDRRITFSEMRDHVLSLANALQALGVNPKDRVGAMLYNSAEYLETLYAASLIGAPMPAVNWHLRGKELCDTVNLRRPRVLIFDHEFIDDIRQYKDQMTCVEHFIMVGGTPPEGFKSYERLVHEHPPTLPRTNFIIALNPYTGGTTGTPKSSNLYDGLSYLLSDVAEAPRTSIEDYLKSLIREFSYFHFYGGEKIKDPIHGNIRSLIPTPMYHAGTAAGYAPCLLLGATAVPMRKFDPEDFLRMIEKERISWSFIVPTILQRILDLPDDVKRRYDLSSMHTLISAAAPCPPEVKKATNELFLQQGAGQSVFHEYYGSSETAMITILLPEDYLEKPERIHSVGKARCGDLLIYDETTNKEVERGNDGKIFCRSVATLSLRYPGSEAKLSESMRTINGMEWYDDGLIGRLDKDGFLYLTSRIKEMIICGGVNLYPKEIEEVLFNHPKVFDVAVIRAPDPDLGEAPLACVQLRSGETATQEEIKEYCKQQGLRGYKIPKTVDFYEELPRHIDGKLIKRELEEKYWKDVERRG